MFGLDQALAAPTASAESKMSIMGGTADLSCEKIECDPLLKQIFKASNLCEDCYYLSSPAE